MLMAFMSFIKVCFFFFNAYFCPYTLVSASQTRRNQEEEVELAHTRTLKAKQLRDYITTNTQRKEQGLVSELSRYHI